MLFRAKIICPHCQSARCRKSRRLPVEEKQTLQGRSPYRCLDCTHRFLAQEGFDFGKHFVISAPIAIVAVILSIAATFWLTRSETPSVLSASATLDALDPEVMKAAEAGDPGAQFRLGEALLQDPTYSAENSEKAYRWLQMAAENGNTEAMIVLGRLSRTGVGVLQNFGQASKWIETAAARGNPEGMLEMGRLYRDGVGVEKDYVKAYVWFNRASAVRNLDAVREREAIARILTVEELKMAQNQSSAK